MIISTEILVTAGAFATLGGIAVGAAKNFAATWAWVVAQVEARRTLRNETRVADLGWTTDVITRLRAELEQQGHLADLAVAKAQEHRETIAEQRVWIAGATQLLRMHGLTHLIDPPPGHPGGDTSWPTPPPPNA